MPWLRLLALGLVGSTVAGFGLCGITLARAADQVLDTEPGAEAECQFKPISEDLRVPCRARFNTCGASSSEPCDPILWVTCRGKTIFKGLYLSSSDAHVVRLTGVPYGSVGNPPSLFLHFDRRDPTPPSTMYAILNYKSKNRFGECKVGPGSIPD